MVLFSNLNSVMDVKIHVKIKSLLSKGVFLIITCFVLLSIFSGCDKDDNKNDDGKIQLLESLFYHLPPSMDMPNFTYEYDNQNRLNKILIYTTYLTRSITFTYSGNNLAKVDNDTGFSVEGNGYNEYYKYIITTEFSKNGNTITFKKTDYFGDYSNGIIYLDKGGFPTKYEETGKEFFTAFTFQIENGNLTKITYQHTGSDGTFACYNIYKYDNKKSPFYYCKTQKWYLFLLNAYQLSNSQIESTNNPENVIYGSINNVAELELHRVNGIFKTEFEYEYDSAGFPTIIEDFLMYIYK